MVYKTTEIYPCVSTQPNLGALYQAKVDPSVLVSTELTGSYGPSLATYIIQPNHGLVGAFIYSYHPNWGIGSERCKKVSNTAFDASHLKCPQVKAS